jgi:WD40 repeat protein
MFDPISYDKASKVQEELNEAKEQIFQLADTCEQWFEKAALQFESVVEMKQHGGLKEGSVVITFGEEVAGDSLVKVFKVVEDENAVPEGAIESHQLADDKWVYILTILREADKSTVFLRQTSPPLVSTALNAPVILSYKFGALTPGTATVKYYVNSMLKFTEIIIPGEHSFDISPFLTVPGTHVVDVVVSNAQGGSASLSYSINIVELSLRSIFDSSTAYTGDISFRYTPYGAVEKTIHFILDGVELETSKVTSSGVQQTKIIDALDHGAHILEVFATAVIGGSEVRSNLLRYLIVAYEAENETIIIGSMFDITETVQGTVLNIPYRVYNPASETTDIELYIDEGQVASLSVDRSLHYWNIANYPVGMITFSIVADEVIKSFVVSVAESEYYVEAITEDLDLYLTAAGRSNSEAETRDEWVYGETVGTLTDFNWLSNGWILDNEEMVLRVSGEARVNIPYKLFAGDPGSSGLTLEVEFKSRLVENLDTVLLSCFSGNIGFKITPQMALLATELMNEGSGSAFTTLFKEDEKIRVSFVVEPRISNKLIFLYINGICSGVVQYDSTDNFTQNNPVGISIGSNEASIDIYTIRKYSSALSAQQVLDNYIADTYSISERARLILKNDIFDAYSNVDYNKVVNTIPCLTVIGPLPSVKGDKKTVSIIYENRQDPTKNISFMEGATIDIQGTSSQYYPRKNYKLKLPEPYQLKDYSKPEKTFCFKADYMESSHAYNTGNARLFNEMMKLVSKIPPQEIDDTIRTTIDGYPCVIFYRASMESPLECFGAYNFNLDKSSYSSFGHVGDDIECWEFCDNSAPRCNFLTWDDQRDVFDDFEARYPDDYEDTTNLERVVSWVASFAPGAVNEGNISKFKSEIGDYWDLDSLLAYYCIVMVGGMIDSLAKNLFIESFDGDIWYPIFYDMDTCYGLNNEGVLGFDYGIEFQDPHGSGHVWNGHQSVLWNILEEAFPSEIQAIYRELRNNYGLTYDNLIDMFVNEQIGKIPEALYNYDNDFKYLQPLYNDGIGTYLYIAQGTREHHLKWWLKNRFVYMDSKYMGSDYVADYATMRLYTPTGDLAVEPDGEFILTSAVDQYLTIKFGAEVVAIRAKKDVPTEITPISQYFNDTETIIYGASNIKDFGELANKYAGTVDMSNATRVSRLIIGSSETGYKNSNLRNLSLGNNIMLKELNVENCENLGGALNLSGCVNIEEVYAQGTTITSVALPTGGNLKKMELPATITNITIRNHTHINSLIIPANSNLTALRIEGCPTLDIQEIIENAPNLQRIRLLGVAWVLDSAQLLLALINMKGIDGNGNNTDTPVVTGTCTVGSIGNQTLLLLQDKFPGLNINYSHLINEHRVEFRDALENVLDVQFIPTGGSAVDPITRLENPIATPVKESTAQYDYTFSSWDLGFTNILEDKIIRPVFTSTVRKYTVRFLNYDSAVLQTIQNVEYGSNAVYTGVAPIKEGELFDKWDPLPVNIQGNTDCYATFSEIALPEKWKPLEELSWGEIVALSEIGIPSKDSGGALLFPLGSELEDAFSGSVVDYNDDITVPSTCHTATFNPDGTRLILGGGSSTSSRFAKLYSVDTNGVTLMSDITVPRTCLTATFNPDDTRLVLGGGYSDSFAKLYSVDTNGVTFMSDITVPCVCYTATFNPDGTRLILGGGSSTSSRFAKLYSVDKVYIVFCLGDTKSILLSTNEEVLLRIADFEHDTISGTDKKAKITFDVVGVLDNPQKMNSTNINTGGWDSSDLRLWLNTTFLNQLPFGLQALIKSVDKYATTGGAGGTTIVKSTDKIFAPSILELGITGQATAEEAAVTSAYPVYSANASRIRKSSNDTARAYWTRTAFKTNETSFMTISTSGSNSSSAANTATIYVSPAFCIGEEKEVVE